MHKKIIPIATGGALLGATGAAGATKINRKRKMDAEINTAIMNMLPQSFTDEDRARIAREIMKGAESRTGSEKLAAVHQAGSLVFGEDGINDLFKEAVEELRKEENTVSPKLIGFMSDEAQKRSKIEYGFTAYRDKDGKLRNTMQRNALLSQILENGELTDKQEKEYRDTANIIYSKGTPDAKIHKQIANVPPYNNNLSYAENQTYFDKLLDNRNIAWEQGRGAGIIDTIIPRETIKFRNINPHTGEKTSPVTGKEGMEAVRKYLNERTIPHLTEKVETETKQKINKLTAQDKALLENISNVEKNRGELKFYQFAKKLASGAERKRLLKERSTLNEKIKKEKLELAAGEHSIQNFTNWKNTMDKAIKDNYDLYEWNWY